MADPYCLQRQTAAKHDLLRHYLKIWARVLSGAGHKTLAYIDGFSFAGMYTSDEDGGPGGPGSPLIALQCFDDDKVTARGVFLFVDEKKRYIDELKENVVNWPRKRAKDEIRYASGRFDEEVIAWVEKLEARAASVRNAHPGSDRWKEQVIPAFVFIDPYGPSGFPMELVGRILRLPRTEVFINLMWVQTARNLHVPSVQEAGVFTRMFGTDQWRELLKLEGEPRREAFLALYLERLRAEDGASAKFARSFEMCGKNGAVVYWMVFCTNAAYGWVKMKEAMWKVDPGGAFKYRDTSAREQGVMFGAPAPPIHVLKRQLLDRFKGRPHVSMETILKFVREETLFIDAHAKAALRELEAEETIKVTRPPTSQPRTFGDRTAVHF